MIQYIVVCSSLFLIKLSKGEIFAVTPGDGNEFEYSPVDRNATIYCAIAEEFAATNVLDWTIDDLSFDSLSHRGMLNSRRIIKSRVEVLRNGINTSSVILFGDIIDNNSTRVCCQAIEGLTLHIVMSNCTTLIIYGRPLTPEQAFLSHIGSLSFNISWTASRQVGVEQNYTIVFYSHVVETSENYHIFQLREPSTTCGLFLAYVQAVNGAGESDPSNNVTIPSLPDIEPVTASLTHQVWKSNGHIMVNVSFQPARYCKGYPVVSHMLTVRSQQTRQPFLHNMSLAVNETEVVLDNLEEEQKYVYSVTATNEIGTTNPSEEQQLITTDVQTVTATMRGSVIEVKCHFIPGTDARGCQISLRSNCSRVTDVEHIHITRNGATATRQLSIPRNISCYRQVVAYTIDMNNTISNFSINGTVQPTVDNKERDGAPNQIITIIVPTVSVLLIVAVILMMTVSFIIRRKPKRTTVCPECKNIPPEKERSAKAIESPTTPDKKTAEQDPPPTYATVNPAESSTIKQNDAYNITSVIQAETMPIYALPEKLKHKNTTEQPVSESDTKEKAEGSYNQLNEHVYHVLEGGQAPKGHTADPQTYESPKKSLKGCPDVSNSASPPGPVYQEVLKVSAKKEKIKSSTRQKQPLDKNTTCGDTTAAPSPGPVYQEVLKISAKKKKTESSTNQPVQNTTSGETAAAKMDEAENKGSNVSDQPSTSEQ